jgi:hypothetical protein
MTVQELIDQLNSLPKEFKDLKVAIYSDIAEDSAMANSLRIYNKSEGPYNKGDDVWAIYNIPADENVLFIGQFYQSELNGDTDI